MKELRDIPGYEGKYAVTEDGQVWSYQSKKFMKIANGNNGYQQVYLSVNKQHKNMYLHRLVALAWIPNPDNLPEVNHKDENKANCAASNLEWCDRRYNLKYSNLCPRPKRAVYCIELDKEFDSIKGAATALNLHYANVAYCCRGTLKSTGGYHFRFIEEKK